MIVRPVGAIHKVETNKLSMSHNGNRKLEPIFLKKEKVYKHRNSSQLHLAS